MFDNKFDDTAVSPVVGVILMVAVTVILAAVIGSFVLDLGSNTQQNPSAGVTFDEDPSGDSVGVQVISADNVDDIRVKSSGAGSFTGAYETIQSWNTQSELDTARGTYTFTDGLVTVENNNKWEQTIDSSATRVAFSNIKTGTGFKVEIYDNTSDTVVESKEGVESEFNNLDLDSSHEYFVRFIHPSTQYDSRFGSVVVEKPSGTSTLSGVGDSTTYNGVDGESGTITVIGSMDGKESVIQSYDYDL